MHSVTSNAVAVAGSYTADEHFTGRYWKNGRKIFEKTIYMGVAYFSSVPHGISNLDFVIFLGGTSPANNGQTRPIPFVFYGNTEWSCGVGCDSANVFIEAGSLFCNYHSTAEITMLYTKTTD